MFNRLAGLETEYAIRTPAADSRLSDSRFAWYQRIVERLRQVMPIARAHHFKDGWFLANGGAIWFEADRPASGAGLIEVSTPECRSPFQLLTYQRAMDRLVGENAARSDSHAPFWLIKNDRDGAGNVYGAQENYEVVIASGFGHWIWRSALVLLLPLVLVAWAGFYLLVGLLFLYLAVAGLLFLCLQRWVPDRRRFATLLFGRDLAEGRESGSPTPPWIEWLVLNATRILSGPLALCLWILCACVAFRRTRQALNAFLMSRCIVAGAGYVQPGGQFALADKAGAINCLVGFGGYWCDRPVYTMGHFFKALCAETLFSLRHYFSLFSSRQRLQIALGDSNMCEHAEYLKIATTFLVLDAIEAGYGNKLPSLQRPLQALQRWIADPTLSSTTRLSDGSEVTALDVQWRYYEVCRQYAASQPDAPDEVWQVLERWHHTLRLLSMYRQRVAEGMGLSKAVRPLIGLLDWATKLYLLGQLQPDASWAEKKKIDIRYHELSPEGYYQRLVNCGVARRLVTDEPLHRAMRVPPPDSPATRRGHLIREFSDGDQPLRVNWKCVIVGTGQHRRVFRLSTTSRKTASSHASSGSSSHSYEARPGAEDDSG